jgi:hypothetical protein
MRANVQSGESHLLGRPQESHSQVVDGSRSEHILLDEYANMKQHVWTRHVRAALSDRNGTCDFIGVPEGRNHYYDLRQRALADKTGEWGVFEWTSAEILDITNPGEIEAARRDLDELTFQQEYEGRFVSFSGMAYYRFNEKDHYRNCREFYDPLQPLIFTFDFNVSPGVANVIQELAPPDIKGRRERSVAQPITCIIGEVHIPRNSNTIAVCQKLIKDWGQHRGRVICYGDATGGSSGTAKTLGSDWDIIKSELRPVFGDRLAFKVKAANPTERSSLSRSRSGWSSIPFTRHSRSRILKASLFWKAAAENWISATIQISRITATVSDTTLSMNSRFGITS